MEAAKVVLFKVTQAYLKKQENFNKRPNLPSKGIRKKNKLSSKSAERKEIIKTRVEINRDPTPKKQ